MAPSFTDDKSPICIPFILKRLKAHQQAAAASPASSHTGPDQPPPPLIIGLNGLQGVGKSTLVVPLAAALEREGIPTLVCSIDDFYLTHQDQVALARQNPDNALWQVRGEPGTHDIALLKSVLSSLLHHAPTTLPLYDKALFSGQGDRLPLSSWIPVNHVQSGGNPPRPPLQVIILEGWCVGFRPISPEAVAAKRRAPNRTLHRHRLEHLLAVNEKLKEYDEVTDLFDAFLHIDSEKIEYVYDWRLEQEEHLRLTRGDPSVGMTKELVVKFVDAYYPAYELYLEGLRNGLLPDKPGSQLRMMVGRDRKVKQVVEI
ncbi:P-loop containing nucleoside triphosphate hydrolase protein [Trichoderma ceciliae]